MYVSFQAFSCVCESQVAPNTHSQLVCTHFLIVTLFSNNLPDLVLGNQYVAGSSHFSLHSYASCYISQYLCLFVYRSIDGQIKSSTPYSFALAIYHKCLTALKSTLDSKYIWTSISCLFLYHFDRSCFFRHIEYSFNFH